MVQSRLAQGSSMTSNTGSSQCRSLRHHALFLRQAPEKSHTASIKPEERAAGAVPDGSRNSVNSADAASNRSRSCRLLLGGDVGVSDREKSMTNSFCSAKKEIHKIRYVTT